MKHAFIMNCHNDIENAIQSTTLLKKYWSDKSEVYLYLDGLEYSEEVLEIFRENCTEVIQAPYEKEKSISIINALNELITYSKEKEIDVVSFLHADMIPIFPETFYGFVERFHHSHKFMSYTPLIPGWLMIEFTNMHFWLDHPFISECFPASQHNIFPCNEYLLTRSFCKTDPKWTGKCYPMFAISLPITLNEGRSYHGSFIFHNYTPETSVVHTNDPWFWDNYETLSVFEKREYPRNLWK